MQPRLIALIGRLILPCRPQCHTSLPGKIRSHSGKLLLRGGNRPACNQHLRLQVPCNIHAVLLQAYTVRSGKCLAAVKKQHIHGSEPCQQLGHLCCQELPVAVQDLFGIRSPGRPGDGKPPAAKIAEVLRRKVKSHFDSPPAEGFRILPDQIFPVWRVHNGKIGGFGVPEAEAVVMLGGQNRIPESRQPGKLRQMVKIPPPGMQGFGKLLIKPGYIRLRCPHQGMADDTAQLYIQRPVNKQPHSCILKPLQRFRAVA